MSSRAGLGGSPRGCAAAAAALTTAPFLTAQFSHWEKDHEMPFKSAKLFSWRLVGANFICCLVRAVVVEW